MRPIFTLHSRSQTLELGRKTRILAIVNITPDSFYDGGVHLNPEQAIAAGLRYVEEGADILDLGAQSTRPGSSPIGSAEELRRLLPVLRALRKETAAWISIDTYRADVASACLQEGADLINDVSSFRMDPAMPGTIAQHGVPVVCMHFLDRLHPMPQNPQYADLFGEIRRFFQETIDAAERAGIARDRIILDPGIGFGKNLEHNLEVIRNFSFLQSFGLPLLAGPSRKSFIGKITGLPAEERLEGSAAAAAVCVAQGAHFLRVHDVSFFRRFCDVLDAILV